MPLKEIKKEIEIERLTGYNYIQLLCRAEAMVSGAGREAVEPLLWDANAAIIRTDIQKDRLVLDGTMLCQAVYRQGDETTLRALSAKSSFSQAMDIPGALPGMLSRVEAQVEHCDVHYENGHMIFQTTLGIHAWIMALERIEFLEDFSDENGFEKKYTETEFVKLAADADETAVMTASVDLPHSLDARNTLMDWGCVLIDSVQPDLGGIRIKGRAMIETLISSGIEGRPAVVVKYPIEFDKLIELPEWLSENVQVCAQLRNIRTQVENDADTDEGKLQIQTDVHFGISANVRDKVKLLSDAYGTGNECIKLETEQISACGKVILSQCFETVRGTVITDENSPDIGSIIAVRALPDMAEISKTDGGTGITGIIEADVLYMPSGGERPSTTHVELPFEMNLRETLAEHPLVRLHVVSAEANALMSDRIEMKIVLCADYESRILNRYDLVKSAETLETVKKKRGYVVCWPSDSDDSWSIGKRYGIAEEAVRKAVGEGSVSQGNAIILCT